MYENEHIHTTTMCVKLVFLALFVASTDAWVPIAARPDLSQDAITCTNLDLSACYTDERIQSELSRRGLDASSPYPRALLVKNIECDAACQGWDNSHATQCHSLDSESDRMVCMMEANQFIWHMPSDTTDDEGLGGSITVAIDPQFCTDIFSRFREEREGSIIALLSCEDLYDSINRAFATW